MSLAARLTFGAALVLGATLVAPAIAQDAAPAGRAWTDPPARGAAAPPVAKSPDKAATAPRIAVKKDATSGKSAAARPTRHASRQKQSVPQARVAVRAKPAYRPVVVTATYPTRQGTGRRIAMRSGYGSLAEQDRPMGEVGRAASFGGWANEDGIDRIRAAQAAGYIVMRSRSVQFPDGRTLQTYRPMGDDQDED